MYVIDDGTDCVEFCGYVFVGSSLLTDCKIEVGILMIDWLFYQQYYFESLFAKEE